MRKSGRRVWFGAALLFSLAVGCHGRPYLSTNDDAPQPKSGPSVAILDLREGLPDVAPSNTFGLPSHAATFLDFTREVKDIVEDDEVKGVFVRLGGRLGPAKAEEVSKLMAPVRAKLPVYCYADAYTNFTYYLAARSCTKIFVPPASDVETIGIASQLVYMRRLLQDNLHFDIDFLQVGKFKGAEEPITRDGPSPEARESLEGYLSDVRTHWLDEIEHSRKRPELRGLVEDGPYSSPRAKELGLVDEVGYMDDAKLELRKSVGAVRDEVRLGAAAEDESSDSLSKILRKLGSDAPGPAPVAVILAKGSIVMAEEGGGIFGGDGGISEKGLGSLIQKAEDDQSIKAVVLRIDSPGGSALASDLLWHKLMKIRKKKPLVISVGEMAASGGYYLASAGQAIYVDHGGLVGSIGVVGGKIGVGGALERIGVHAETFPAKRGDEKAARRAAYLSMVTPWDDETRARVRETMGGIYELFLARISEGRSMPKEKVAASAEGRIFGGDEGLKRGLVDSIGGLEEAVGKARELASLPKDARYRELLPKSKFLAFIEGSATHHEGSIDSERAKEDLAVSGAKGMLRELSPQAYTTLSSLSPLLHGEQALCAMPYGLEIF